MHSPLSDVLLNVVAWRGIIAEHAKDWQMVCFWLLRPDHDCERIGVCGCLCLLSDRQRNRYGGVVMEPVLVSSIGRLSVCVSVTIIGSNRRAFMLL